MLHPSLLHATFGYYRYTQFCSYFMQVWVFILVSNNYFGQIWSLSGDHLGR